MGRKGVEVEDLRQPKSQDSQETFLQLLSCKAGCQWQLDSQPEADTGCGGHRNAGEERWGLTVRGACSHGD